jgi:hypothetical protein
MGVRLRHFLTGPSRACHDARTVTSHELEQPVTRGAPDGVTCKAGETEAVPLSWALALPSIPPTEIVPYMNVREHAECLLAACVRE